MKNYRVPETIRIGTRGSKLALAQTELFIDALHVFYPEVECEQIIIKTKGDKILDKPLVEFGGKAVFVTEFEEAIKEGRIDLAVHSAKDMPMELMEGLDIVCTLKREDVRDVIITRAGEKVGNISSPIIGTGSLRRQCQIRALYPDVKCESLRGNVPTRIEKLRNGQYDGIILAAAGLKRLQLHNEPDLSYEYIEIDKMVPAAGQGIIAIEGVAGHLTELLENINDEKSKIELFSERMVLKKLGAGCHEPVGVHSEYRQDGYVVLSVMKECNGQIIKADGKELLQNIDNLAKRLIGQLVL